MTKRRKQRSVAAPPVAQEEGIPLRLRFQGGIIELTPTAAYPIHVLETMEYAEWINGIADPATKARLSHGVDKMRRGLFGDWKEIGAGVSEMRLDFGPG